MTALSCVPQVTRRAVLGAASAVPLLRAAHDRPLNLLFLIADDHAGYVMGADGNRQAVTPHLDRLATEGARFAQHYCNSPVCTPSRQSILTGRLPHAAGVTLLQTPLSQESPTLPRQLAAKGYQTAVFGKMHFNQPGTPGLHGFQTAVTEDIVQRRWLAEVGPATPPSGVVTKPAWRPFKDAARIWLNAENLPFPRSYDTMKSTWVTAQATRFLTEHRDTPFALWVSLQEPHSPFDFPLEDRQRFVPERFPVPRVGPEDHGQIPLIFRDLSPLEKQGIIAAYYTSVGYLDRNIGVVLAKLQQLGLAEQTLVVYLADHGYSLGQHGRFEKHCSYDPALRAPLMMRLPGRIKPAVVREFTESVDVAPTVLELLRADPLPGAQGQSLVPYLRGVRPPRVRSSIFSEYLENEEVCLRNRQWKLVHGSGRRARTDGYETDRPNPGRTVRLYDLRRDPGEFINVAAIHPEVVAALSTQLLARFQATHPEASQQPAAPVVADAIEWYLRPRDAKSAASGASTGSIPA